MFTLSKNNSKHVQRRSQWPCGLRRRSAAASVLTLWVRIRPGHWCLSVVSVVCCQVEFSAIVRDGEEHRPGNIV